MGVDFASYGTPRAEIGEALHEYLMLQDTFIATKLFPFTPVPKKAAVYPVITRKSLTALADVKRAARSAYNRTNFQAEDFSYSCQEHGLEGQLDASERSLYKNDFDAEMETAKDILNKLLRAQEVRVAAATMTETVFDTSAIFAHAATVWSNVAADIIGDVQKAMQRAYVVTGMEADTLTVSRKNFNYMLLNTAIRAALLYTQGAEWNVIKGALARILGVRQILVGVGVYDTIPEGATAATIANIWGDAYALLSITPAGGSIVQPSLGRTFAWTDESPENTTAESYEEPQTRSTIYRVRQYTQEALIEKWFGQLIDTEHTS